MRGLLRIFGQNLNNFFNARGDDKTVVGVVSDLVDDGAMTFKHKVCLSDTVV